MPQEDPTKSMTKLEVLQYKTDIAEFMLDMLRKLKIDYGFRSITMANAPWDYYCKSLEERAKFLGAPTF